MSYLREQTFIRTPAAAVDRPSGATSRLLPGLTWVWRDHGVAPLGG